MTLAGAITERKEDCLDKKDLKANTAFNVYKGWLIPYLIVGDYIFNNGRWVWWLKCIMDRHIPNVKLPQICFDSCGRSPKALEARKNIEKCIDYLAYRTSTWDSLTIFMDWMLWGLGNSKAEFPKIDEEHHMWLYKNFNIGLLLQAPHDYWGDIIAERKGNGSWNPTAFYPTPENVVSMMHQMVSGDGGEKGIFKTVIDPALGTGRMLMYASNESIFLYGTDIDPVVIRAANINLNLYAPWGAFAIEPQEEQPYYSIPESLIPIAEARFVVAAQMYGETLGMRKPGIQEEERVVFEEEGALQSVLF